MSANPKGPPREGQTLSGGPHPIPAAGQPLPESPRPCLGCIMAAATQDAIATASVTATMANHMSTSTIDDEPTRRLTVPCLGHKTAESGRMNGLQRRAVFAVLTHPRRGAAWGDWPPKHPPMLSKDMIEVAKQIEAKLKIITER